MTTTHFWGLEDNISLQIASTILSNDCVEALK